ncbi:MULTISPECIES: 23S rRNA (guanosine(2251)-2'-O)-methyltransferase RlmB [Trueperella]|uniref:23S rRNA (Guanosine(2251)-2'-O)-methyltransferase RlmB n=1 Tax=Trueperella bernardiae TaxID=59561 RepID=A0A0W1KM17_9ACTO|nr:MULTISPECIES: 23S rRNA (guanosine(2251)-2'-O)-methyltransferase RlmB [Trueperella]KTF04663.1 putative TrmH family tRNA/rRNA methyltransferase [Trueperella bernardiae]MDK8600959.1 23S rRNA (guanosine(2251)-2'-O)-methyltransferase RlmB [Trueperella bernardiae]MDV6238773.1 23S rRNA (guanosine(2251)-2'-O)-methyltransferase RlmB [Trueperella bernardiae]
MVTLANAHRGRPGAVRKNAKKGSSKGTGGHSRKRLEGKGPTPKAEDRTYHPAYKKKQEREAAAKRAEGPKLRGHLRQPEGYELVAGRNPVYEAVQSGIPYERVFLVGAMSHDERVAEVARAAMDAGTAIVEVTRTELDMMTGGAVHQGVAIEVPPYEYVDVERLVELGQRSGRTGLIVALDSVTDPHNLGAVMRSAAAFRADGVLIPERRSASVNATVWKVSAGAAARLPVARETNLVRALSWLKEQGYFVLGLAGDGEVDVAGADMADVPVVLVTGSEGAGLSRLVRETCDVVVSIPIDSATESLNAAVATGIALYQIDSDRKDVQG